MKSLVLGVIVMLVAIRPASAELIRNYFFSPSDAEYGFGSRYKFDVRQLKGRVIYAELFVTPAARPISNAYPKLHGGQSTGPLLSDPYHSWLDIGQRYVNLNTLFGAYWGLDITEFMQTVTSPYVGISISDNLFKEEAYMRVATSIPEPSSLAALAAAAPTLLLIRSQRERGC